MTEQKLIKIDVAQVLSERLGRRAKYLPGFVGKSLARLIHQDELNGLLEGAYPRTGAEFCEYVIDHLGISLRVEGRENMPADGRVLVASNHPLGGLDGISMIAWLKSQYPTSQPQFVVNDLLMAVEPLRGCFVPVNKHGRQSRSATAAMHTAMAGPEPVVVYPAGLVSRRGADGSIADLDWRKTFINKAVEYRRDIVPVYFEGLNSPSFYRYAHWRRCLGIKFNLEMVLLPREIFRSRGKSFTIRIGQPIPWQRLEAFPKPTVAADSVRRAVYAMATGK